jgi:hypothetical protein
LTAQNWHDLELDIDERVGIWYSADSTLATVGLEIEPPSECRNLMLFGLEDVLAEPVEVSLDEAGKRFLQDLGPLEVVFNRIQDETYEFLYFRRNIIPEVRCLLEAWRLDPKHASKVRPYKKLAKPFHLEFLLSDIKRGFR